MADERIDSRIGELGPSNAGRRRRVAATAEEHGVTPRELFFDLVFVFAFTQVAPLLTHELVRRAADTPRTRERAVDEARAKLRERSSKLSTPTSLARRAPAQPVVSRQWLSRLLE